VDQHYKVIWKRQRRVLEPLPTNSLYPHVPDEAYAVHFEPTDSTKRSLQKLGELNEFPATSADLLVGPLSPGSVFLKTRSSNDISCLMLN